MPGIYSTASSVTSNTLSFTTKTILSSNQSSILAKVKQDPVSGPFFAGVKRGTKLPLETQNEVFHYEILDGQLQTNKRRAQFTVYALERLLSASADHRYPGAMMNDASHYKTLNQRESFVAHLRRIYQITEVPLCIIVNALHYLMRVQESEMSPYRHVAYDLYVNDGETLSGMFTTSLIIANHFCEDHAYSNQTWAKVSAVTCDDINASQRQFLALLNYRLHITVADYQILVNNLLMIYNDWTASMPIIGGNIQRPLVSIPFDINLNNNNNINDRMAAAVKNSDNRKPVHVIAASAQITYNEHDDDLMSISDDETTDNDSSFEDETDMQQE